MKKKLVCFSLALSFALGNVSALTFADDSWKSGWTGKEGGKDFTVEDNSGSVVISNDKVNNGKFSDGEDSIIYYANEVSADNDFTLSAKVTIDEYNVMEESSNPQQGSVGIAVLDSLYNKTDDIAFDDAVFLGAYAEKKDSDAAIYPVYRDGSAKKTVGEALSDTFSNTGEGLGTFDLKIKKTGSAYTLTCGENSTTIKMDKLEESIYPCLYIARNVKATFTDVSLDVETRKAVSLTLSGEYKKDYLYGDDLDISSLTGTVVYDDGSQQKTQDFLVSGYNSKKVGAQKVTLSVGNAKADIDVTVSNLATEKIEVEYPPVKTKYALSSPFDPSGLVVTAYYADGTVKTLDESEIVCRMDGTTLNKGTILKSSGRRAVRVSQKPTSGIDTNVSGEFTLEIGKKKYTSIKVEKQPVKTKYYLGDKFSPTGMIVSATYTDDNGKEVTERLRSYEYKVVGFNSATEGEKVLKITDISGSVSADLYIKVVEKKAMGISLSKYPRTTYAIGEEFDGSGAEVVIDYDNGDKEPIKDYTLDTSAFSSDEEGKTSVTYKSSYGEVKLDITVADLEENKWRSATFGQSSGYDKPENASVTAENYGEATGKINVKAWNGSGKITNDHDGMTYYYTPIKGDEDFILSADVTVNKYLEHDNDDTKRNGQEAFGIMLRDVIPLVNEKGDIVTDVSKAEKDSEGEPVASNDSNVFASNMAIIGGYSGTGWPTDTTSLSYDKNTKINRINLLVRQGVTSTDGGGTRVGPYALSSQFPKEGNRYRITAKRLNGGIYASCYDYQTEETMEKYFYDESFLSTQSKEAYYVGFFASRWADIDVENVDFHTINKATDQSISTDEVEQSTPGMYFKNKVYSDTEKYTFNLDVRNSYGTVTIKLNNDIVVRDEPIKGIKDFTVNLAPESINSLVCVYTPEDTLSLTSYEPIVIRKSIYQKTIDKNLTTLYASPEGSFDAEGTKESPFDIDTAIGFVQPGQTVVLAGGTYKRTEPVTIAIGDNGTKDAPKTVMAEPNARAVIDGGNVSAGVVTTGNYWVFKNIDVTNCAENQKGFHLAGSNNIVENCKFYNNRDMGMQISRESALQEEFESWPSNNLIVDCEAYNNCDPSMINADGFGAKLTVGNGNIFRNCSSHHNVDDGWDCYTKVSSGAIGAVTLENCKAYKNGFKLNPDGTEEPYGAGGHNGFKMGGENVYVKHVLINCSAYDNDHNGITTNSNPALKLVNVKAYNNKTSNIRLYSDKPDEYDYDVQGVVSLNGGEDDVVGTLTQEKDKKNASQTPLESEINFWYIGGKSVNSKGAAANTAMLN